MDINRIAVVGAGTMGAGIAQAAASAGIDVVLVDVSDELVVRGIETVGARLQSKVEREKITDAARAAILARITGEPDLREAVSTVRFVIEAAPEKMETKQAIFKQLTAACPSDSILATNTSSLSVTAIASVVEHPERVIGVHFFNPAPVMALVELIRTAHTSGAVFATCRAFVEKMGKTAVEVKEAPGFVVNRLLMPMINEAAFTLMQGVASREDIDTAMQLGANHPIGPLALADMIGLDVCLEVMQALHDGIGDSKYRPCPLLIEMVQAGRLGRKTGTGFYEYA